MGTSTQSLETLPPWRTDYDQEDSILLFGYPDSDSGSRLNRYSVTSVPPLRVLWKPSGTLTTLNKILVFFLLENSVSLIKLYIVNTWTKHNYLNILYLKLQKTLSTSGVFVFTVSGHFQYYTGTCRKTPHRRYQSGVQRLSYVSSRKTHKVSRRRRLNWLWKPSFFHYDATICPVCSLSLFLSSFICLLSCKR